MKASLFDHVVGAGAHRRRDYDAKRFCGREVDDKLEFGRREKDCGDIAAQI
jgi:hypothetical protein